MIQEGSISDPTVDADNAVGVVEFWGGKTAYYYHSRTTAHGYDNCIEIIDTEGKVWVNLVPHHHRVQILNSSGIVQDATPGWIDRYREASVTELERFRAVVLEGKELLLLLTTAYFGLQIALALQESLRTGRKIGFDDNGVRKEQEGGVAKH
ncbi:hypothetical protein AARAC_002204 [Aspergillus arachidicola]|uniref:Gfo/Idh/MocA-like oxidoreductase C-terminal domain-containing protein n=1 Tax=Aspergillus arachidicola TaxID=656916 RepID=A0A2G7FMT0_9EURO|nr:hypothetical protein AARAC_002204 [Aspergillus arachidicola]